MEADRHAHRPRRFGRAPQQFRRAGLDAVGRQHGADKPVCFALERLAEALGFSQAREPPRLVEEEIERAVLVDEGVAGTVGRAEIDAQPELRRGGRRVGELLDRLAPRPIEQRCDGQRGRDAAADEPRERVSFLERELLARVHLDRPGIHVGLRPHPPLARRWLVIETQHRRVEVREGVEVDEARADQRTAVVERAVGLPRKALSDEEYAVARDRDLPVLVEAVPVLVVADDPLGLEQGDGHFIPDETRPRT